MKYQALYDWTIEHGGATVRISDNKVPVKGFAVGGAQGDDDFIIAQDDTEAFDVTLIRVLRLNKLAVDAEYVGTWLHEGSIHIDLVNVFASRDVAIGYALATRQLAIYDIANGKDIAIKRKGNQ